MPLKRAGFLDDVVKELDRRSLSALGRAVLREARAEAEAAGPIAYSRNPDGSMATDAEGCAVFEAVPLVPMKIIQRPDREGPESVPESEIRWGANHRTLKWALTSSCPVGKDDAPYVRQSPSSPWGIRVESLGEGR